MDMQLSTRYGSKNKPSALLNSIFASTVNTAAKTLVAVSSNTALDQPRKWKAMDHVRYAHMLMTWFTVWVLRVLMDYFPSIGPPLTYNSPYLLGGSGSGSGSVSAAVGSLDLVTASLPSFDLDIYQHSTEVLPVRSLGRALTHVLALLNELPANSRKYQFTISMADRIIDENTRTGHDDLHYVNRVALSSAFARTIGLLHRAIKNSQKVDNSGGWPIRLMGSIPLGSYLAPFVSKGLDLILPSILTASWWLQKYQNPPANGSAVLDDLTTEKYAQELLWITNKMRSIGAADEALVQWSLASALASLTLSANPRVQGFILKISAILFGEITSMESEISDQVKFRLLAIWLPVFCYADNGYSYPVLSGYEKLETERTVNALIASLPAVEQEVVLSNWVQDFSNSNSDWPNLQYAYDRWCHSTRDLVDGANYLQ